MGKWKVCFGLVFSLLIFGSCKGAGPAAPSAMPSATPSVPMLPVARPSVATLETRADGRICAPLPEGEIPAILRYPIDLAVTPDGQDIYIVSKHCDDPVSQKPYLNKFNFTDCGNELTAANQVPRSYIYHLRPDRGLEILKIDGKPPLSCELGEDIEMDSQGRLYVTTPHNHRIYRIDPKQGKLEHMVEARQVKIPPDPAAQSGHVLSGPAYLYMFEDKVYFSLEETKTNLKPERHIGRVELDNQYQFIETYTPEFLDAYPNFMVAEGTALGIKKYVYIYTHDSKLVPLAPASLNSSRDSAASLIFDPLRPFEYQFASNPWPAYTNPIIGDLRIDPKPDPYGKKMNIYASHPSWHHILQLPNSEYLDGPIDYGLIYPRNKLYVHAGIGKPGLKDGGYKEAQFNFPVGLALDDAQNLYVADMGNHAIRKITQDLMVSTLYPQAK